MQEIGPALEQLLKSMPTNIRRFKPAFAYLRTQGVEARDAAEKKAVRKYVTKQRKRMERERRLIEEQVLQALEQGAFTKCGHLGRVAVALLFAKGLSSLGRIAGRGRGNFYSDKADQLRILCELLAVDNCGFTWGWGTDPAQPMHKHVLYVDLPQGQVSFHSVKRFPGPKYNGEWDGCRDTGQRIIEFCLSVAHGLDGRLPDGEVT